MLYTVGLCTSSHTLITRFLDSYILLNISYILCKTRKLSKIYWTLDTNWAVIGLSTKVGTRRSAEGTADRVCGGEGGGGGDGGGGDPVEQEPPLP